MKLKNKLLAGLGAIALLVGAGNLQAQILVFQAPASGANATSQNPSSIAANISVDGLQRIQDGTTGGNVLYKDATTVWVSEPHWASQGTSNSYQGARSDSGYVFTVTAASGYTFDLTSVTFRHRATSAGPGTVGIKIGSTEFGGTGTSVSTTVGTYNSGALGLTNLTSATFIVQGWNSGGTGNGEFQMNDLQVFGSVNADAPPASDNNSVLSVPATSTFGRVMEGSSQSVTVSNTGDATTYSTSATGGFSSPATGSVTEDGTSNISVGVGTTLGNRSGDLTVTNTAADSAGPGQGSDQSPITSSLSATVVQDRQVGRAAADGVPTTDVTENVIDVGATLVNHTATGSGVIHTVGADNENTRVTLNADQTVAFSTSSLEVNLYTGASATEFNSASTTANVTGDVNYTTSGLKTTNFANLTAANGALTGEGLTGESVQNARVYFRADVYEAADLTFTDNTTPLGAGDSIQIDNAATSDGGQRAAAEISGRNLTGAGWSVSGLSIGTAIAEDSGVSGGVGFDAAASGLLNGATSIGSLVLNFQHANQAMQGASANDLGDFTWDFSAVVSGNNSGVGEASVGDGGSFDGLGIASTTGSAGLLGGTASAARDIEMQLSSTPLGSGVGINASAIGQYLNLSGTGTDTFVLSLSYTGTPDIAFIQWWDGGSWVNAVDGNSGGTPSFFGDIAYNQALHSSLGSYGFDSGSNTAWAVLDHNSDFVVVPEPSTWLLIGLGLSVLIARRKLGARKV